MQNHIWDLQDIVPLQFVLICANVKQKKHCSKFFEKYFPKLCPSKLFLKIIAAKNKKWLNLCRKN
jgi:hypothetical protein